MKVGPKYKICRRLGDDVFAQCQTQKFQIAKGKKQAGKKFTRGPRTEYGKQLLEKQKVRYSYYINEKQLSNYVKAAREKKGADAIKILFESLESRLDTVIFRARLVGTRAFARQIASHGHMCVNGRRVNVPSYALKKGDVISVREGSAKNKIFEDLEKSIKDAKLPDHLTYDPKKKEIKITGTPNYETRQDVTLDFGTVIEFYSRV